MFAEGFRDKIFDTMTAAAFESALAYNTSVVGAVKFFITAITQGVLRCFRGTYILIYLQRAVGTKYLSPGPSLHLEVH